jgi:CHASE3 domain sensor protein
MQAQRTLWEQTQPVLALGRANRDAEATALINSKQAPAYDEFVKAINELINYVETDADETAKTTTRFISKIRMIGNALAGIAIFIAIGTGFGVAGIARRIKEDNRRLQIKVAERK